MAEDVVARPGPPPLPPARRGGPTPRRQPGLRDLLSVVAIVWCVEVCNGIVIAVSPFVRYGFDPAKSFEITPEIALGASGIAWAIAMVVLWYFACAKYNRPFRDAFAIRPISRRQAGLAAGWGLLGAGIAAVLVTYLSTGDSVLEEVFVREDPDQPGQFTLLWWFPLFAVLVPPFEELYYRGFIFPVMRGAVGPRFAIAVVSVWFLLPHVPQAFGDWIIVPMIFLMGLLWTVFRSVYDSITPCIISHFTYNAFLVGMTAASVELSST